MDRKEVWEHVVGAIEREFTSGEFGEGEFVVRHNENMGLVTVYEHSTSQAFALLDVSGAAFSGGDHSESPVCVRLPIRQHVV